MKIFKIVLNLIQKIFSSEKTQSKIVVGSDNSIIQTGENNIVGNGKIEVHNHNSLNRYI